MQAQAILLADDTVDHEYLSITGLPEFVQSAAKLILGADSPATAEGRVTSVQTISGTGANHLAAVFLANFYDWKRAGGEKKIYISNPTWANHKAIFNAAGITPVDYPYVSWHMRCSVRTPCADTLAPVRRQDRRPRL